MGDSIDDMVAGYRAGAATVLLANEHNAELKQDHRTGLWITSLDELVRILDEGLVEQEVER